MSSALAPLWRLLRRGAACLVAGALLLGARVQAADTAPAAGGGPVLALQAAAGAVDAWPALTMLPDPGGGLQLADVLARRAEFVPVPATPHANLGPRQEAVWLRLRVTTADTADWVLAIDYPSLDRVDVFRAGHGETPLRLGREQRFSERPMPARLYAATLRLDGGVEHELLLRVQTRSTMVLPITLSTPRSFQIDESRRELLQGLMAGAALCLLVYSFAQWLSLRDPMFLYYAVTLAGNAVFFAAYFGIGAQHLWGENLWAAAHAPPLAVLVALTGGFLFIERALAVGRMGRLPALLLRAGAVVAAVLAVVYALDGIDYRSAQRAATVLGPLPMLIAVPVAFLQARRGDRIAIYILVGWGVYGLSTLLMAALLRGWIGANFWSQHAFQFGLMFEMAVWMRVLGVRIDELRAAAQRASLERDTLRSLAHTDALTGLPNRRGLDEALSRALGSGPSSGRMTAVYLLDLDGFKPVNDRWGHGVGDALLVAVARRLQSLLRGSDTVARLGGDEFVVLAQGLAGDEDARALGQKLLEAFDQPLDAEGHTCQVGLTIGYALAPVDGTDALGLLQRADAAMYAGKQAGRHCLRRGTASVGLAGA